MGVLNRFKSLLFVVTLYVIDAHCSPLPVLNYSGTEFDGFDGPSLIKLGRKVNKPVLTILGMVLNKFNAIPCSEWAEWSQCVAQRRGSFGTRSRQRKCKQTYEALENERKQLLENDLSFCEGICPLDYNVTQNGYCLKQFKTKQFQKDAKKQCLHDGGNLMNIDSDRKHEDVKNLLQGLGEHVFIDGQRKDVDSPWYFSYGSQSRHLTWTSGQPDDLSISLCLMLDDGDSRLLHDVKCDLKLYFLCEIS